MVNKFHTPVLLKQAVDFLRVKSGEKYIDATLGHSGHALEIVKLGGVLLGIDCDPQALDLAKKRLSPVCPQPFLIQGNFSSLKAIAEDHNFSPVAGILFDLGTSSAQLTDPDRGFSFRADSPLDMRLDPNLTVTAKDLVNGLTKDELIKLFTLYSQEKLAWPIALSIVRARAHQPITTTRELASLIENVYRRRYRRSASRIHPATKVFQALRIAVNDELNNLKTALPQAVDLLQPKGRLIVISFHEGEDRIVKHFFKDNQHLKILTPKPVTPSTQEIINNPRARSAKLRCAEKL